MKSEPDMALQNQYTAGILEAGLDEAGRGCLAGPVVAAAVILPESFSHPILNDSKQLSHKQRIALREVILANAIDWAIGIYSHAQIDAVNILKASFLSMHQAIGQLKVKPDALLIDGNRFIQHEIPHRCIVKGDSKFLNIAAASILAKTYRDDIMEMLHAAYPIYDWDKNKGYPTAAHRLALQKHGHSPFHRLSFNSSIQLQLF